MSTTHTFRGKKYTLPFTLTAPLHIPASMMEPPEGFDIQWDSNSVPLVYFRHRVKADHFDAEVTIDPVTGKEGVHVSLNLEEATAKEARLAMGRLLAWFYVAVGYEPTSSRGGRHA